MSLLASRREELYMPLLAQEVRHPNDWAGYLKKLLADPQSAVAASLHGAEQAAIVLGAEAQNHPDYAAIYAAAQALAAATGATLGILPQAANSVGAEVLGVDQGDSLARMVAQPKKAVLLLNVEPEIDVAGGAAADCNRSAAW